MNIHHPPRPVGLGMKRRSFLGAALAGAGIVALPAWPSLAQAAAASAATGAPVLDSHPATEPSGTHIRRVGETNVLFSYGAVVPSFAGWNNREPERRYVDLDGQWRFSADPDASGLKRGWNSADFDDQSWQTISVPSAWDLLDTPGFGTLEGSHFGEGTAFLDGYAWFRRTFKVSGAGQNRHLRLNFLAVGYSAEVWLDGVHLGKHEGANTPFSMPVPRSIASRQSHSLALRVFRRASYSSYGAAGQPVSDDREIPYKPVDYWPYAGITRSVWLESVASVSVSKILVAAANGILDVRIILENDSATDFVGSVRLDPGIDSLSPPVSTPVTVPAGSVLVVPITISLPHAPTWSAEEPKLLTARATLFGDPHTGVDRNRPVDGLSTSYGVRKLQVADGKLLMNGSPLFLKGTSWHEENAEHGRAMTIPDYDVELGRVLDIGANFIRNTVYNRHPYVYEWADKHGVMVMDDIDTMWLNTTQEREQTEAYGLARAMALNMAWNQHNRPSVILWGLQNESEIDSLGAPVYRAWLADLKAAVKAVDLTGRPVTWSSATTDDPAFDLADVIGFNEYFGYFYGRSSDLGPAIDRVHAAYPDKPILITENGTWALSGNHGSTLQQGTEEWQAAYIAEHWKQVVARREFTAGYTLWVLKDYKERAGYNQAYNGVSVLGLVTFDTGRKKLAYDTFKSFRVE